VANRKITEMPNILGISIVDQDLLTVVQVNEVDPTLRNKKFRFDQLIIYLDQYFINQSGGTFSGDITVEGNATITQLLTSSGLTVTNEALVSGLIVQDDAIVSGTLSGNTVSGVSAFFSGLDAATGTVQDLIGTTFTYQTGIVTSYFSGAVISGDEISGTNIFGTSIRAATISGTTITGVSGLFEHLTAGDVTISGVTVSGDIGVSGLLTASGVDVTGTLSGNSITGNTVNVTTLTGNTVTVTDTISGAIITGDTANFSNLNVISGVFI